MKQYFYLLVILFLASCSNNKVANYESINSDIIPKPISVEITEGSFVLDKNTSFVADPSMRNSAMFLHGFIAKGFGLDFGETKTGNTIEFVLDTNITDNEAYKILIQQHNIEIRANGDKGAFFAVQTMKQLLPASFENLSFHKKSVSLPLLRIIDSPRYKYRGFMLDVSRHFFTVKELKRVIDLLAIYKINTLHLHLSDDQGWRIEIKSWPNLTAYGSKSSVKNEKGGFYTQLDYIDIQNYALKRHIEVIPEIDMPGHTNAALASYPELNCNGKVPALYSGTEVGFSSFCVDKEITYTFVDDVLRELSEITIGRYIHIGGDESKSTDEDDYIVFINNVRKMVKSHGKIPIGWDEIANADIEDGAIVQYWGDVENVQLAASKNAHIIMSPADRIYLDIKYNDSTKLGLRWSGLNDVQDAYSWKVDSLVSGVSGDNIIGVEAPLWTETIVNGYDIEYMVFPRIVGVAEIAWSQEKDINWQDYKVRLSKQKSRFEAYGINYYKSEKVDWK